MLEKFLYIIDNVNRWFARVLAWLVVPMLLISMYEVIARYLFNSPTLWSGQVISILFVILVVPGGGYLLLEDEHVRMDVFYSQWNPRKKAVIDAVTFIIFFAFALMLSWKALEMAWSSVSMLERSWGVFKGPIYPKKIALATGAVLLLLQGIAQFIKNIKLIKTATKTNGGEI
ncbi:TRAP transporter small permease subunit [Desulfobacula sp.]|uniref:TRAP transporter small permease subunit n=1 Tax=Desulfobacula sp. TaxID=2593537 RepID=UPI0026053A9B|nr:TRAP transporter small permease subunit [Desulfobacula sp.]